MLPNGDSNWLAQGIASSVTPCQVAWTQGAAIVKKSLFGGFATAFVSVNLAVADEVPVAVYKAPVVAAAPRFYGDIEYLLWG